MKLTKIQKITNYAKNHPEGFSPKQLMEDTKLKDKNIWVTLSKMKKQGLLKHDTKTRKYKLLNTFNKPGKVKFEPARDGDIKTIEYLSKELLDHAEKYKRLHDQYVDALAIIRYLENKLFILIRGSENEDNDARGKG